MGGCSGSYANYMEKNAGEMMVWGKLTIAH